MTPFPTSARRPPQARIAPATRDEMGIVNAVICGVIGRATGTGACPRVFTTLARHRRLFRGWLRFAAQLMPRGTLPRTDTELVILRVSVTCGSDYEWGQHVRIARRVGLSDEQIARVGAGPDAPGWSAHEAALLRAVDELARDHVVADGTWAQLRERYDEAQMIELCLLAGHYTMLAGALSSLGVQPEGR